MFPLFLALIRHRHCCLGGICFVKKELFEKTNPTEKKKKKNETISSVLRRFFFFFFFFFFAVLEYAAPLHAFYLWVFAKLWFKYE